MREGRGERSRREERGERREDGTCTDCSNAMFDLFDSEGVCVLRLITIARVVLCEQSHNDTGMHTVIRTALQERGSGKKSGGEEEEETREQRH
jgi:hypothetical protein